MKPVNEITYISIKPNSGSVPRDAENWAYALFNMITKYCEKKNFKVDVVGLNTTETGGITSATLKVEGDLSYNFLKSENGVHCLIHTSEFTPTTRRQNTFATVKVKFNLDTVVRECIRSYIKTPYELVKDIRTGEESSKLDEVLNGDLDKFVKAYLNAF